MKTIPALFPVITTFFMSVGICLSQPSVTNGSFDGTTTGWTNCGLTGPEMGYPESNYGGPSSDYVAEIDNGDSKGICQTISGFTSGASAASTPNLFINYSRRIQGSAPSTVGLQVCLTDPNNAANTTCTTFTSSNSTWVGYATLNWNFATPTITSGTSLILSIKSAASPYYDQGGAYCPDDPDPQPNNYLCANTYGMVVGYVGFNAPTPVTLLNFTAVKNDSKVDLEWQTASEKNNHYFVVEKSKNGVDFIIVDSIDGSGTTQGLMNYSTTDPAPYNGISYYRLKQVDYDGKFSYSKIAAVENEETEVSIYPNPNQGSFKINVVNEKQACTIAITDAEGRLVYNKSVEDSGNSLIEINGLTKGVYVVRVAGTNTVVNRKLVVL